MDTTATIPTGAMAERWKFIVVRRLQLRRSRSIIYPIYANWVWGGGWLSQLGTNFGLGHGHVDFAGQLGRAHDGRRGGAGRRQDARAAHRQVRRRTARPSPIPGHNIPMVVLGTFILAFGWFGFNPGSTLAGTDTRIAIIAVNTMLASASGAFAALPVHEDALRQARRQHGCATACWPAWSPSPRPARSSTAPVADPHRRGRRRAGDRRRRCSSRTR